MTGSKTALILFSPSGRQGRFPLGTTVLEAARVLGVDIDSICGGRALCCRCQVEPVEGSFAREGIVSAVSHLGELTQDEASCLQLGQLLPGRRLGCRTRIMGDIRIDVPAASQVHQQVVRKAFDARPIELDPLLHLYFVDVPKPESDTSDTAHECLLNALESQWGLTELSCGTSVLRSLNSTLEAGHWQATIALRDATQIVAIWPGFRDKVYGAAVDVGSTTIAVHLCDLATGELVSNGGAMNPQIRFGEDLMSRVSYAMLHADGASRMTYVVRSAINDLLLGLMALAGVDSGQVLEVTLVGNPVMHHLLLGLDPAPLGHSPFKLVTDKAVELPATELDLQLAPAARAYLPPCIAGFVGADTAAVILAEAPWAQQGVNLIIDIGTNAEIVLSRDGRVLAASSPTGPAFEGAQISNGQRAARGAIERVRIDPVTLEPRFKLIGSETWSDNPRFEAELGEQPVTGICGSGIIEAIASMYLAGIVRGDGVIDGGKTGSGGRIQADGKTFSYLLHTGPPEICIRQADVRAIQLAKAALYASSRLLMDHLGVDTVDRIRLAGAFGSYIDVKYAMVLGLIPDCDPEHVTSANNAAGAGACIALLNKASRTDIEKRVCEVEKIETATDPNFQQYFVEALGIPHANHRFPKLSRICPLPEGGVVLRQKKRQTLPD